MGIINLYKKGNFSIRPKAYINCEVNYNDLEIVKWNDNGTCYSVCYLDNTDDVVSIGNRLFTICKNSEERSDLVDCLEVLYYLSRSDER